MKKRTFLLTMASMLVAGPELLKAQASPAKKKSLVAYFSRRGYNYLNGEIVFLQVGNTEVVAKKIRELTGSDLFQIETVKSYPNWWGTMPMAVHTFLESYDFAGKTIIPFCTHEGSAMGRSEGDIKKLCPKAKVLSGLAIKGGSVNKSDEKIAAWCKTSRS